MKNFHFLRKFSFILAMLAIFTGIVTFQSCSKPPPCETNNTGDVTFYDNGPSYVWDGCYLEIDWANGSYSSGTFYTSKTYSDKSAGSADVYMEWEDADAYYWSYGYITLIQCSSVNAYCTWSKKKSAIVSDFISVEDGQISKNQVNSIEEFRLTIKKYTE